ncbi:LEM domain-containing protein 1 isoform 2-T2 [Mantella aurantiaca]
MDIRSLSNTELKEQLLKHGVIPGPILPSTRSVYEKKLLQLLEKMDVQENGGTHEDQHSDSDNEGAQFKGHVGLSNEEDDEDSASMKNYSHTSMDRRSSLGQTSGSKYKDGKNWALKSQPDGATSDDLPELLSQSALGMSATRRKPIKGAAGRPIQFQYDDIVIRARMKEQAKEILEEKKPQRLVSVPLQIAIFVLVAFTVIVLLSMESSPGNPFEPPTEETKLQLP